jgi:hypothetical protein
MILPDFKIITMKNEMLAVLEGKEILTIEAEVTAAVPLSVSSEDEIVIKTPLKITVDEYILFVYNRWRSNVGQLADLQDLKGRQIIGTEYDAESLQIQLSEGARIEIDLTENGYVGSESLVLYGPDEQMIVWE